MRITCCFQTISLSHKHLDLLPCVRYTTKAASMEDMIGYEMIRVGGEGSFYNLLFTTKSGAISKYMQRKCHGFY